jgi:hypothetical protein
VFRLEALEALLVIEALPVKLPLVCGEILLVIETLPVKLPLVCGVKEKLNAALPPGGTVRGNLGPMTPKLAPSTVAALIVTGELAQLWIVSVSVFVPPTAVIPKSIGEAIRAELFNPWFLLSPAILWQPSIPEAASRTNPKAIRLLRLGRSIKPHLLPGLRATARDSEPTKPGGFAGAWLALAKKPAARSKVSLHPRASSE